MGRGCHVNTVLWTGFMETLTFEERRKVMGVGGLAARYPQRAESYQCQGPGQGEQQDGWSPVRKKVRNLN